MGAHRNLCFAGWRFAALLVAALVLGLLQAAPVRATTWAGDARVPVRVCVLRDDGTLDARQALAQAARFDCTAKQYTLGPGDFWAITPPIDARTLPGGTLRVRFESLWLDRVTLYAAYPGGKMHGYAFDQQGLTRALQLGTVVEQPLPAAAGAPERLLWRVQGAPNLRGIVLGAAVLNDAASERWNLMVAALYGGFAGLCIALIVYNLALWASLRMPFQLAYCVMVGLLLIYSFSSSGYMAWVFPDMANNDRLRFNHVTLAMSAGAGMIFARTFFEPKVLTGLVGRMATAVAILVPVCGLVFLALTYLGQMQAADMVFSLAVITLPVAVVPIVWRAWMRQSRHLWLFGLAWATPVVFIVLRILSNLHVIPKSLMLDNSTVFAMSVEALLSAVAIAYRVRALCRERDLAVENEVIARRLADTDPLTGLLNRRAFLDRAIGRTGEQQLLIADLDHFKGVNETLGHDGGDEVLRIFARILRLSVPAEALVARIGGEEFAIVSAVGDPVDADALLGRLRGTRMPFDLVVTASIGICTGPLASETDWKTLYRGADRALFDAKQAGRDRTRQAVAA